MRPQRSLDDLDIHAQQLAGGISQQPAHLRFPGQVEDAENVDFEVLDGIVKRRGSIYRFRVTGLTANANYRLHAIDRDSNEQYLLVYGVGTLRAFSVDGVEATITDISSGGAAASYVGLNSATDDQLRVLTVADTTLIANKTVYLRSKATDSYTVTAQWPSYQRLRSHTPAANTYHQTTEESLGRPAGYYKYVPDVGNMSTFAVAKFNEVSGGTWNLPSGSWDTAGDKGFKIRFQRRAISTGSITWTQSTKRLFKTGAFASYDHRFNDDINITGGTGITTGWASIAAKISDDEIELEADIGPNASNVTVNGIGDEYEIVYAADSPAVASMYDVALKIEGLGQSAGASDFLCEWRETSPGSASGRFYITCPYRASTRTILSVSAPTTGTDLTAAGAPFNSFTVTAGTGSDTPIRSIDSRWVQVAAPGSSDGAIDQTKAPIKLTRTVVGSPSTFTLDTIPWSDRLNGDADSNPSPSVFIDNKYPSDLAFLRQRFVIAAGESIVMSQANDLFNFYLNDPEQVVDSDPIDLTLSSDRVTTVDYLIPWRQTISVFTVAGQQFELGEPESLTPSSASVVATTRITTRSIRPATIGSTMYFVGNSGSLASSLREYYRDEQFVATEASDVTAHVPTLLPSSIRSIAAHPNSRRVFVLATENTGETFRHRLYVYAAFWSGSTKQQSAWTKWVFDDTYRIVDIAVMGDNLWMLVENPGGSGRYLMESIPMSRDGIPPNDYYQPHLDRQMELTGVYDGVNTTWTFPAGFIDTSINTVVSRDSIDGSGVWHNAVNVSGTAVRVAGNHTGGTHYVGRRYYTYFQPTRPFARDQNGNADLVTSLLQRKMTIVHGATGAYSVLISVPARPQQQQTFVPPNGTYTDGPGFFQCWPLGDVEQQTIQLYSYTPTPWVITGIQRVCDIGEVPR